MSRAVYDDRRNLRNVRLMSSLLRAAVAVAAVVGSTLAGCSTTSADQCTTGASGDSDCEGVLGVAVGAAFCDNGTCRLKATPPTALTDGGVSSNPDGGKDAKPPPCVSTEKCTEANGGRPSVCARPGVSECLALETDSCKVAPGDGWKDAANAIYVGVLLSKTFDGSPNLYDETNEKIMQLAESEWRTQSAQFTVGDAHHPIVGVYCDTQGLPDLTKTVFDHLTLNLKAPVVIGGGPDSVTPILDVAKERDTFLYLSEYGCDDLLLGGQVNGRCYTSGPPTDYSFPMVQERVKLLEAKIRADRALAAGTKIKVALLASRTNAGPSNTAYIDRVRKELKFNDAFAADQPDFYKEVGPVEAGGETDYLATAKVLTTFAPDIIVTFEARAFHFYYMPMVEASWPSGPRPYYVTTESAAFTRRYQVSVGGNEELRHRVSGVWFPTIPEIVPVYDDLSLRYAAAYPPETDPGGISSGLDAFYASAYGIAAALTSVTVSADLKGGDVGRAMKRLVGGEMVTQLKPVSIPAALDQLKSGKSIDLVGSLNLLDWDPVSGTATTDAGLYCVYREPDQKLLVDDAHYAFKVATKTFVPPAFPGECP